MFVKPFSAFYVPFFQVVGATPTSYLTAGLAPVMLYIMDLSITTGLLLAIS